MMIISKNNHPILYQRCNNNSPCNIPVSNRHLTYNSNTVLQDSPLNSHNHHVTYFI
ncbi:hypothetical protein BDA99DRAFT_512439 [Phascolomyces articulosus]|uniref:Uncharacterized protein n=1 Tax=Phascolomyces articulosus TaxID=60185 RepID=A0AAD5JY93_9FUNG|nr:hypothetical protein BDA99DRAFT_512439 [Phascolomyces articulosus]